MVNPLIVLPFLAMIMIAAAYLGYKGRLTHPSVYLFVTAVALSVMVLSVLSDADSPILLFVAGFMSGASLVLVLIVVGLLFVALNRTRYVNRSAGQVNSVSRDLEN